MNCFVYRSNNKPGLYLYLKEKDNFNEVPESLIRLLGETKFSFEFDLGKNRKLVRAEAKEVLRIMKENGYFLQMPPPKSDILEKEYN
ncbi:MAG TPA: YcgL domain-containing protein [Leucothrix sp.]|nr:YcgL domain-containing protein [Leucothrix sp.]